MSDENSSMIFVLALSFRVLDLIYNQAVHHTYQTLEKL